MNIILLGAPGSGKGTQAEKLAERFNLYHLQTGALARELAEKDPRIKEMYSAGKLLPAEEMTMHVINFLTREKEDLTNILFEGFPRFISQYDALENFLKNKGDDIDAALALDISEEEAIKRISGRRICDKCGEVYNLETNPPKGTFCDKCGGELIHREDDKEDAIKVRFQYYYKNTEELINYLDSKGKLIRINAERPINKIFTDIVNKLENIHV